MKFFRSPTLDLLCCIKLKDKRSNSPTPPNPLRETCHEKTILLGDTTRPADRTALGEETADSYSASKAQQQPNIFDDIVTAWPPGCLWAEDGQPYPFQDAGFRERFHTCARELIGLRLVTTYRDFVRFVLRRLDQRVFHPDEWPLHPHFSWDQIADAILEEQKSFTSHCELGESYPWLKAIDDVGSMLRGVRGLVLSDEIVGITRPDVVHYSRDAIQRVIDSQTWSYLASRLAADMFLVPLAFRPDEGAAEAEFTRGLHALKMHYFDYIVERPRGYSQAFLLKGEQAQLGIQFSIYDCDDDDDYDYETTDIGESSYCEASVETPSRDHSVQESTW